MVNFDSILNKVLGKKNSLKSNPYQNILKKMNSNMGKSGASLHFQKMWKKMSPAKKQVMRSKFPDSDGDRVPDRFDCQPNNVMRQDFIYSLRPKDEKILIPSDLDRDWYIDEKGKPQRSQWSGSMYGRHTGWYGSGVYGFERLEDAQQAKTKFDQPMIVKKVNINKPYRPGTAHKSDILHVASKELYETPPEKGLFGLSFTADRFTKVLDIPTNKSELIEVKEEARRRGVQPINVLMEKKGYTGIIPSEEYQNMSYGCVKYQETPGWQDDDGDEIINAEDCNPNNPNEQGPIHQPFYYAGNNPPSQRIEQEGKVYGFSDLNHAKGWKQKNKYKNLYVGNASKYKLDENMYSRKTPTGYEYSKDEFIITDLVDENILE